MMVFNAKPQIKLGKTSTHQGRTDHNKPCLDPQSSSRALMGKYPNSVSRLSLVDVDGSEVSGWLKEQRITYPNWSIVLAFFVEQFPVE